MLWASKSIKVGDYPTTKLFGLTIDVNVVVATFVALAIFLFLFWLLQRKLTAGVPGKVQMLFEIITVDIVGSLAESAIGEKGKRFVPAGVGIFIFILICNFMSIIPSTLAPGKSWELLPAPTSNVNLPLAMALTVIIWVHIESVRARRPKGYVKHYFKPYWWMSPINVIEEITKPITMTFRLFGNLFSGALMIVVISTLVPLYFAPVSGFIEWFWHLFDGLFLGGLQAYIFMLLTILYFGMAMSHDDEDHAHVPSLPTATAPVVETSL